MFSCLFSSTADLVRASIKEESGTSLACCQNRIILPQLGWISSAYYCMHTFVRTIFVSVISLFERYQSHHTAVEYMSIINSWCDGEDYSKNTACPQSRCLIHFQCRRSRLCFDVTFQIRLCFFAPSLPLSESCSRSQMIYWNVPKLSEWLTTNLICLNSDGDMTQRVCYSYSFNYLLSHIRSWMWMKAG